MGENSFKKEDNLDFNLISIKGKKEYYPNALLSGENPLDLVLPEMEKENVEPIIKEKRQSNTNRESSIFSAEFYQEKINRLNDELEESHNVLADLKKVIKIQKQELEKKSQVSPEKIKQLLSEKHGLITNIHQITKELNDHYSNKLSSHKKELDQLKKDNNMFLEQQSKVMQDLTREMAKNKELKLDFQHLMDEHKKDMDKRDAIIKQLYEENTQFRKEAKEENIKAKMYERISLEAKNDALTFYEKFNEVSNQLKEEQVKRAKMEHKAFLIESEFQKVQKQLSVIKDEYDLRVKRIKEKQEEEVREIISGQTRNEMVLKSQIYSLTQNYEELEKKIAREKQKKQDLADEIKQKISSFITPMVQENENESIIYNVPKDMRDYDI